MLSVIMLNVFMLGIIASLKQFKLDKILPPFLISSVHLFSGALYELILVLHKDAMFHYRMTLSAYLNAMLLQIAQKCTKV